MCTYSTHQVPLLLEERIGKDAMRAGVAILQPRCGRHTSKVAVELAQTGKESCATVAANRRWRMHDAAVVVALAADAFVLLLYPSNLVRLCKDEKWATKWSTYMNQMYTLGDFVDDECTGEGEWVANLISI